MPTSIVAQTKVVVVVMMMMIIIALSGALLK
jgi:hypothetical protein